MAKGIDCQQPECCDGYMGGLKTTRVAVMVIGVG